MMHRCRCIICDKHTALAGMLMVGEICVCRDRGCMGNLYISAPFCYEPKTALKNSLIKKILRERAGERTEEEELL